MKSASQIHLSDVQSVYSGPEGRLWQLLMGEQIHFGGLTSSMDLRSAPVSRKAGRALTFAAPSAPECVFWCDPQGGAHDGGGRHPCDGGPGVANVVRRKALADRIAFVEANVCATGLAGGKVRFRVGRGRLVLRGGQTQLIAEARVSSNQKG